MNPLAWIRDLRERAERRRTDALVARARLAQDNFAANYVPRSQRRKAEDPFEYDYGPPAPPPHEGTPPTAKAG